MKRCSRCRILKRWAGDDPEFWAKVKWPDGTMRQPQAHCKVCARAATRRRYWRDAKASRERAREYRLRNLEVVSRKNREAHRRRAADPELHAIVLEQARERYRRRNGVAPNRRRHLRVVTPHSRTMLPVGPLATVLRDLESRLGLLEARALTGLSEKTFYDVTREVRATVSLDTADRALLHLACCLDDLYPEALAA